MLRLLTSLTNCPLKFAFRSCARRPVESGWIGAFAALVGFFFAASAAAQPTNDNFAQAQIIGGVRGTVSGSNVGATTEAGEPPIVGIPAAASIWYRWTAPRGGPVTFDT